MEARGKQALADVKCYCKMTSIVVFDSVTSFLCLKGVTYSCKHMRYSPTIGEISSVHDGKLEETEEFNCVFVVYCELESK